MRWDLNNHPFHSHEVHYISLDFQSQHVIDFEQVDGRKVDFSFLCSFRTGGHPEFTASGSEIKG